VISSHPLAIACLSENIFQNLSYGFPLSDSGCAIKLRKSVTAMSAALALDVLFTLAGAIADF
jgi:hypothetical protein